MYRLRTARTIAPVAGAQTGVTSVNQSTGQPRPGIGLERHSQARMGIANKDAGGGARRTKWARNLPTALGESGNVPGKAEQRQVAGELGFEPRLTESESAVLPLNYSPIRVAPTI